LLLHEGRRITADAVKAIVTTSAAPSEVPALMPALVDLHAYDALLPEVGT